VGGLTLPVDTADQVVCLAGQIDGHSSLDYTISQVGKQWNNVGPQTTLLMPP